MQNYHSQLWKFLIISLRRIPSEFQSFHIVGHIHERVNTQKVLLKYIVKGYSPTTNSTLNGRNILQISNSDITWLYMYTEQVNGSYTYMFLFLAIRYYWRDKSNVTDLLSTWILVLISWRQDDKITDVNILENISVNVVSLSLKARNIWATGW